MKRIIKRTMWILLIIVAVLVVTIIVFLNQPSFGKLPSGERQTRIEASPNFRDGHFHNRLPTTVVAGDKSRFQSMYDFLFREVKDLRPQADLPTIKTDLKQFDQQENVLVWMGHSSLYMQVDGIRFLVDPVLKWASPISFVNKAFNGINLYTPDEIPDIDYLLISHDHWDHLDYNTVKQMKGRIGKVICGLGVGEHFEHWGFDKDQIIELDWNDETALKDSITIHTLPARHFSGRGLNSDKTLWVSFMLEAPSGNIFLSGDSGYDIHFGEISKQFPTIDFAIMENGQYDNDWKDIHMMPEGLVQAVKDLNPKKFMTVHNSKYALGKHTWYAPMDNISQAAETDSMNLITPMIGEVVYMKDSVQVFNKWWEYIK